MRFSIPKAASLTAGLTLLPFIASAQVNGRTVFDLLNIVRNVIALLIPLLIGASVVVFFWGIFKYIKAGGGENKTDGLKMMAAGIVGLFVMVAVWGLVNLLASNLGVGEGGSAPVPTVPGV